MDGWDFHVQKWLNNTSCWEVKVCFCLHALFVCLPRSAWFAMIWWPGLDGLSLLQSGRTLLMLSRVSPEVFIPVFFCLFLYFYQRSPMPLSACYLYSKKHNMILPSSISSNMPILLTSVIYAVKWGKLLGLLFLYGSTTALVDRPVDLSTSYSANLFQEMTAAEVCIAPFNLYSCLVCYTDQRSHFHSLDSYFFVLVSSCFIFIF